MNWEEALEEISSPAFRANLSVISGTSAFFKAIAQLPAVLDAQRLMLGSGELKKEVLGRIYDIAAEKTDPEFLNPNDKALATFLWLTAFAAPDYVETAAKWTDRAPQCWYARHLARRILNPPLSSTRDYRFGEKQDETRAGEMWSGDMRFAMRPPTETRLRFYDVDMRQAPSDRIPTWKKPEPFMSVSSEGIS